MNEQQKAAHRYYSDAMKHLFAGEQEQAIASFSQAIAIDPQCIPYYLQRGSTYYRLKRYEQALRDFDEVIRLDPTEVMGYYERAVTHHLQGDYELAVADYSKAISLNAKFPIAFINRGRAYERWGKTKEAIQDFRSYLKLSYDKEKKQEIRRRIAWLQARRETVTQQEGPLPVDVEDYRALLDRLLSLQRALVQVFESEVSIVSPLPPIFGSRQGQFEELIKPKRSVSQILRAWPDHIPTLPMHLWVRPRIGVLECQGQNWLFQLEDSRELTFTGLPPGPDAGILELLRKGETEALAGLRGLGPAVHVRYHEDGTAEGVSWWEMHLFASSLGSRVGDLSPEDHKRFLAALEMEDGRPGGNRHA